MPSSQWREAFLAGNASKQASIHAAAFGIKTHGKIGGYCCKAWLASLAGSPFRDNLFFDFGSKFKGWTAPLYDHLFCNFYPIWVIFYRSQCSRLRRIVRAFLGSDFRGWNVQRGGNLQTGMKRGNRTKKSHPGIKALLASIHPQRAAFTLRQAIFPAGETFRKG